MEINGREMVWVCMGFFISRDNESRVYLIRWKRIGIEYEYFMVRIFYE